MRKTSEELNKLCEKYNTDRLWSWSRINCVHNSMYEYYLKYVANPRPKPDRDDSIYVICGSSCHDILEDFYNGKIKYEEMVDRFDDAWTTAYDIADLKFNRSDSEKNGNIADKYYLDIMHFFKNHKPIKSKIITEQFVTTQFGEEYCQGYVDATTKGMCEGEEDVYTIIDWKSSSLYKGVKLQNECGQLVMYAIALNQKGIPFDKIRICWNFLKYSNVTICMKNGSTKVRQIERSKIGESLQANAKMWLKHFGYDEFEYLDNLVQTNDISALPEEVQEKFAFEDCFVYVDLTEDLIQRWTDYIIDTTKMIRDKEAEYEENKDENIWWESDEEVAKQSFYFANLCQYSPNLHKPYAAYLSRLEAEKSGNIFGTKKEYEDSLDWLNDL